MRTYLELTILALTEAIVRERAADPDAVEAHEVEAIARFLVRTAAGIPDYLRLPMASLTLAFGYSAVPTAGRPFHSLSHERRKRQVEAWRNSRFGFRRDLIKFYETLAIFGWYSERYGTDYSPTRTVRDHDAGD